MANSVLLSGPAGANKSQAARDWIAAAGEGLIVAADFQSIYAALTLAERDRRGRYPAREAALLPLPEYVRRAVIIGAREREIDVVATNSDGSPERRAFLLRELGEDATEEIIDPGRVVVEARLTDPITGELSEECAGAVNRWYLRAGR